VSDVDAPTALFFDLYREGRADEDAISDGIEAWHDSGDDEQRDLPEFLGMTDDEYAIWAMDGRTLPLLAESRRTGRNLRAAVAEHLAAMQANPKYEDRAAIYALTHWVARNPPAGA
jgi:hypothetical protein